MKSITKISHSDGEGNEDEDDDDEYEDNDDSQFYSLSGAQISKY